VTSLDHNKNTFTDENWREVSLFTCDEDVMMTCELHGEWAPKAFYTDREISADLMRQGYISCPYCLMEIVGECPAERFIR